jgi:hypothetical protein
MSDRGRRGREAGSLGHSRRWVTARGPRGWPTGALGGRIGDWFHMSYVQRVTDMDTIYPYPQNY